MTPFEQAEENIRRFAERLVILNLIQSTIEETKDMEEHASDLVWLTILTLLENRGMLDEPN
jgi:hypothetical protein